MMRGIFSILLLTGAAANCEGLEGCAASSPALLQRQRKKFMIGGDPTTLYGNTDGTANVKGIFEVSYDPSVYTSGTAAENAELQEKAWKAIKEGLSVLLGHGVNEEEITLQWRAGEALLQSEGRREDVELSCLFTFPVPPGADVATMEKAITELTPEALDATLKSAFSSIGVPDSFHIISAGTVAGAPATATTSTPGIPTTQTTSPGGTANVKGIFEVSYDPSVYTSGTAAENAELQEKAWKAIKEGLSVLLGHGVKEEDITLEWRAGQALLQREGRREDVEISCLFTFPVPPGADVATMEKAITELTPETLDGALKCAFSSIGVPDSFHIISAGIVAGIPTTHTTSIAPKTYTLEDVHPCKSFDDFMPDAKMSDDYCDYEDKEVSEGDCLAAGCTGYGYGPNSTHPPYCHCRTEVNCAALGFKFKTHTCQSQVFAYTEGEYAPLIAAAHEAGTCSGFVTSWQQDLKQVLEWPAKMCCRSWPSRLCDADATLSTPCKEPDDFIKDRMYDREGHSCMDELKDWYEAYALLEEASQKGCDGIEASWGQNLSEWVLWPAQKCCRSFPATICEPELKPVTPCKDMSDFSPDNVHYIHCTELPEITSSVCTVAGCSYEDSHHSCICQDEVTCEAAGGKWHHQTCGEIFGAGGSTPAADRDMFQALTAAANGTSCDDIDLRGQRLSDAWVITYSAKACCKSPESICGNEE